MLNIIKLVYDGVNRTSDSGLARNLGSENFCFRDKQHKSGNSLHNVNDDYSCPIDLIGQWVVCS